MTCPPCAKVVQRNLTPMRQLLGELVDDAFDFGELGGFELLVTRFDGRGDAALDMGLEHIGVNARDECLRRHELRGDVDAVTVLLDHPQDAVDLLIAEHQKHPSNPWMFPSPKTGEMYHPDSVVNIHKKILKDAGLEHLRFHDLRHTFATLALQNGVDVKTVSSMLGHFDAGFTLRTYTHVTRQMQESAAEKMGNFMAQVM